MDFVGRKILLQVTNELPNALFALSYCGGEHTIELAVKQELPVLGIEAHDIGLYTEDGVFMPPNNHSAVGKAALRQAYDAVFKAITLHVKFTTAELVVASPEWAFVRTNSAGTNKINATSAVSAEGNQELFIFKKGIDGKRRIARYSFSTTNPAPAA